MSRTRGRVLIKSPRQSSNGNVAPLNQRESVVDGRGIVQWTRFGVQRCRPGLRSDGGVGGEMAVPHSEQRPVVLPVRL